MRNYASKAMRVNKAAWVRPAYMDIPVECAYPLCKRGPDGGRKVFFIKRPQGRYCCALCRVRHWQARNRLTLPVQLDAQGRRVVTFILEPGQQYPPQRKPAA